VTRPRGCADLRLELGVYVLNAIAPADRRALELHLAQCAGCRQELAGLAALPGLLGTVSVGEAVRATSEAGACGLAGARSHGSHPDRPPEPSRPHVLPRSTGAGLLPAEARAREGKRRRRYKLRGFALTAGPGILARLALRVLLGPAGGSH
jgi:hypothetical protein